MGRKGVYQEKTEKKQVEKERGERLLLSFLCYKTYNFRLKLYTKILRKYISGGFDMGLCHAKMLIFNE